MAYYGRYRLLRSTILYLSRPVQVRFNCKKSPLRCESTSLFEIHRDRPTFMTSFCSGPLSTHPSSVSQPLVLSSAPPITNASPMVAPLPARMPTLAAPALGTGTSISRRTPRWMLLTNFGILVRILVLVLVLVRVCARVAGLGLGINLFVRIVSRVVNFISTISVLVVVSFAFVVS